MANRVYLYSVNRSYMKIRDLSESPSEISLFYKILLGMKTQIDDSRLWYSEGFKAITGDCRAGLKRYDKFLEYLKTLSWTDNDLLNQFKLDTDNFFEEHPKSKSVSFLLECGEIFILDDYESPNEQNAKLAEEIRGISKDIEQLLKTKEDFKKWTKKKSWLWELEKNLNSLKPTWQRICYYSMNRGK